MKRFPITIVTAMILGSLMAVPAVAQQGVPQQQQQPQEVPEVNVDEAELETVAEAYVAVQELTNEFNQMVQQAEGAEQAQEIQAEYAERANGVVEEHDLTIERYDLVVTAATADDELRERLLAKIEDVVAESGGAE
jgi:ribosome-binding protein aMBF1 (putative translation factor)